MRARGPRLRRTWVARGWLLSVLWGNGYGFRLRCHRVEAPRYLEERATSKMELKFKPHEWEMICRTAHAEGTSTYNWMKRVILALAR